MNEKTSNRGFTLTEIIVVIFILSIFASFVFPSFSLFTKKRTDQATKLASIIGFLNDTAINRKKTYSLTIDFDGKYVIWQTPDGDKSMSAPSLDRCITEEKGEIREGRVVLLFGPQGLNSIFKAYFKDSDSSIGIDYNPYTRRVRIESR